MVEADRFRRPRSIRYVEGGCSIFQTTTNPDITPETKSRFFILGVDESREQNRRILAMQRKFHTLESLKDQAGKEKESSASITPSNACWNPMPS